jgi:hypothetical protein
MAPADLSAPRLTELRLPRLLSFDLSSVPLLADRSEREERDSAPVANQLQRPCQAPEPSDPARSDLLWFTARSTTAESPGIWLRCVSYHGILTNSFEAPSVCQNPAFGTVPFSAFTSSTTIFAPSCGSLVPRYPLNSVLQCPGPTT